MRVKGRRKKRAQMFAAHHSDDRHHPLMTWPSLTRVLSTTISACSLNLTAVISTTTSHYRDTRNNKDGFTLSFVEKQDSSSLWRWGKIHTFSVTSWKSGIKNMYQMLGWQDHRSNKQQFWRLHHCHVSHMRWQWHTSNITSLASE